MQYVESVLLYADIALVQKVCPAFLMAPPFQLHIRLVYPLKHGGTRVIFLKKTFCFLRLNKMVAPFFVLSTRDNKIFIEGAEVTNMIG